MDDDTTGMTQPLGNPELQLESGLPPEWRVTSRLGRGGYGSVYLCTNGALPGRRFAVKVVGARHTGEERRIAVLRGQREAATLGKLLDADCPNVLRILPDSAGELPSGAVYFATEYLEGCKVLQEVISESGLELGLTRREHVGLAFQVIARISDALVSAHRLGVVHRDIKPANVLVRQSSGGRAGGPPWSELDVVLLDWGVSRDLDDVAMTVEGMEPCTPRYAPPQTLIGTPAGDIYSLGLVLFELLTGYVWPILQEPRSVSSHAWLYAITDRAAVAAPNVRDHTPEGLELPEVCEHVVRRMLTIDRSGCREVADLVGDLRNALVALRRGRGQSVPTPRPGRRDDSAEQALPTVEPIETGPDATARTLRARETPKGTLRQGGTLPLGTMLGQNDAQTVDLGTPPASAGPAATAVEVPSEPPSRRSRLVVGLGLVVTAAVVAMAVGMGRACTPSPDPIPDVKPSPPVPPRPAPDPKPPEDVGIVPKPDTTGSAVGTWVAPLPISTRDWRVTTVVAQRRDPGGGLGANGFYELHLTDGGDATIKKYAFKSGEGRQTVNQNGTGQMRLLGRIGKRGVYVLGTVLDGGGTAMSFVLIDTADDVLEGVWRYDGPEGAKNGFAGILRGWPIATSEREISRTDPYVCLVECLRDQPLSTADLDDLVRKCLPTCRGMVGPP